MSAAGAAEAVAAAAATLGAGGRRDGGRRRDKTAKCSNQAWLGLFSGFPRRERAACSKVKRHVLPEPSQNLCNRPPNPKCSILRTGK